MNNLYFVTSNQGKVKEAEAILEMKIRKAYVDVKEVQSMDVREVVIEKAKEAYKIKKKPVMVEDTGFYIKSLNGYPGALIKWVLKSIKQNGICMTIRKNQSRAAYVQTSICIYNGKKMEVFSGKVEGKVPERPRGKGGFGWDPIFQPKGYDKTFGQMTREEKNRISMRRIALMKMKKYLKKHKF